MSLVKSNADRQGPLYATITISLKNSQDNGKLARLLGKNAHGTFALCHYYISGLSFYSSRDRIKQMQGNLQTLSRAI